jgi:hypothetical protein
VEDVEESDYYDDYTKAEGETVGSYLAELAVELEGLRNGVSGVR